MLVSFSVRNFRSIDDEQTLSMVASRGVSEHSDHPSPLADTDESILPLAMVYGPNGSGKSNLRKALSTALEIILRGTRPARTLRKTPFLLADRSLNATTGFSFRFLAAERIYEYDFEYNAAEIRSERLSLYRGERPEIIFERSVEDGGEIKIEIEIESEEKSAPYGKKLRALKSLGVRKNQLFLTAVRENLNSTDYGPHFGPVLDWFSRRLEIVPPGDRFDRLIDLLSDDEPFRHFAASFLQEAATGISSLHVTEEQLGTADVPTMKGRSIGRRDFPGERYFEEYRIEEGQLFLRKLFAEHESYNGSMIAFPFQDESDGTHRILELLARVFRHSRDDGVFFVDEIDQSLHPALVLSFLKFFLKWNQGKRSQIIATTHDTNLLDNELVRRDEVWFTEKNARGATHLYPLSDFKIRKDLRLDKGYLMGRFGAIPFLGNIERLLEQMPAPQQTVATEDDSGE